MELKKNLVLFPWVILILCNITFCQEAPVGDPNLNKPFVTDLRKAPELIAFGLAWPSAQQLVNQKISTDRKAQENVERVISKCLKPSLYDPNFISKLISLGDWPDSNCVARITQFKKNKYIFHVHDNKGSLFIAIKRTDGNDIWDMTRDHSKFVSQTIETFFINENVGSHKNRKMYYTPNKGETEGFHYVYTPANRKDFWSAYMWTNGKVVVLRIDKLFEEDKKKAAVEK